MPAEDVKQTVGRFYDQVGWQTETDGRFQNAQYEDLRPVSAEYIARAHARVGRHLAKNGQYLLDAGSGPVQAREKLAGHGFYVVADVANLPFKSEAFDGIVSLHTIHHLPPEEKADCYLGLYRCLKPGRSMVTVDGWNEHGLGRVSAFLMRLANRLHSKNVNKPAAADPAPQANPNAAGPGGAYHPAGTFVAKNSAHWFEQTLGGRLPFEIRTWRSVSVSFLRTVIPSNAWGRFCLKVLYRLEEWFPHFFGRNGQYPLIVIRKPAAQQPPAQE